MENTALMEDVGELEEELEEEEENAYREAANKLLPQYIHSLSFIIESTSPHLAAWAVVYGMGIHAIAEGKTVTDQAELLKVSPQALSKQIRAFIKSSGNQESPYMYKKG